MQSSEKDFSINQLGLILLYVLFLSIGYNLQEGQLNSLMRERLPTERINSNNKIKDIEAVECCFYMKVKDNCHCTYTEIPEDCMNSKHHSPSISEATAIYTPN